MLQANEREEIARLWARKLEQDEKKLPQLQRHRNLEPDSAEFICALASGIRAKGLIEIGGSSGLSTIALAVAARLTGGRLTSFEIEETRQQEARGTLAKLNLSQYVNFILGDAGNFLRSQPAVDFVLIDCEKDDYVRFFEMLPLHPGTVVVADNILSHRLTEYVRYVRGRADIESITLPIGKGLEVSRVREEKLN